MSELKLCPFCASDDVRIAVTMCPHWYYGECESCGARTDYCDSQAEAIEAWNSRAERTCECVAEYAKSPIDGKTIVLHRCSACHELMRPHMAYCPSCGAKVVGE